jgi:hypothetical protein
MKHTMSRTVLAGVVAGLSALATAIPAAAAGPSREGAPAQPLAQAQPELTTILAQKLVLTYIQGDTIHYTLNPGFTYIGAPINFNCAHACTIVVQTMVQVEQLSPYWAICPTIDNVDALQGCNWQGLQSTSTSTYVTGNGTYIWQLAAGKHKLQNQVYFSVAGGLDNWGMTVTKYNPQ